MLPGSYWAYHKGRWCGLRSPSATLTRRPADPAPAAGRRVNPSARSSTKKATLRSTMNDTFVAETLRLLDETKEVRIETRRDGDSPEHRTIIWVVVVEGEVFVRSLRGQRGRWYREISSNPEGALHVADDRIAVQAALASLYGSDGASRDSSHDPQALARLEASSYT